MMDSTLTWLGLVAIGLAAGVLSGLFGIGGGVVIVPLLGALLGFSLTQAVGTSLAALLLPVGVFAVREYHRAGYLELKTAAVIALGLTLGAVFGARAALALPAALIQQAYGLFLLYPAWRFAEPRRWWQERRRASAATAAPAVPESRPRLAHPAVLLAIGLGAGVISGMFGVGGGIVIVPALVGLLGFDQKRAVGTSLAVLLLPVGVFAVVEYHAAGQLDLGAAAGVAAGLVVGAFGGARLALGLSSATVKRLYGVFLVFVAVRYLFFP
jgi:uncharacterized membrane protein YfcA